MRRKRTWIAAAVIAAIGAAVIATFALRDAGPSSTAAAETSARRASLARPGSGPHAGPSRDTLDPADPTGDLLLEGQVLDREDHPVEGITVTIDAQPPRTVVTGPDGEFSVPGLLPRRYEVTASGPRGVAGPVAVRLDRDTDPLVLRLVAPGQIAVRVIDAATRAPIPRAEVEVRAPIVVGAQTDAEGHATLSPIVRGHWNVIARAAGYGRGHAAAIAADPAASLTIALVRGASVRGNVTDARGTPVPGARVWAVSSSDWTDGVSPARDGVDAGPDGAFALTGLAPGTYRLRARAAGYATGSSADVAIGERDADAGTIALPDAAVLRGRVVYRDQRPAAGAEVKVYLQGSPRVTARTRSDGTFEIADLPRVRANVGAEGRGASCWSQPVDLTNGDGKLTLVLDLEQAVSGVVVDRSGAPIESAEVSVSLVSTKARFLRSELTDGSGRFEIAGLPDGDFDIVARRPGVLPAPSDAPVRAHTGAQVRITLGTPGSITGRVAFADGTSPGMFTVQLAPDAEPRAFSGDSFELRDVAPGTYALQVAGLDLVQGAPTPAVVVDQRATDVGTIRVARGRTVEGIVVDAAGRPVAGAEVLASAVLVGTGATVDSGSRAPSFQSEIKRASTGPDGAFALRGLAAMPLSIVASHATAGRSQPSTLEPTAAGPLRLELVGTSSLSGTARIAGLPMPMPVAVQPHASPLAMSVVLAGQDGAFVVDRITPGRYSVSAAAGDPLSGAPLAPVTVDVEPGRAATVAVEAVRGSRGLEVATAAPGIVFVTTEPVEAGSALELVKRLGVQPRGHWAMRVSSGTARFSTLLPVAYTACAVAIDRPASGMGDLLKLLATEGSGMPVVCRPVAEAASAVSLR